MKRIFLFSIILLFIIITSCNGSNELPDKTVNPATLSPRPTVETTPTPSLINIYKQRISETYDYNSWEQFINETYNLQLSVNKYTRLSGNILLPEDETCIMIMDLNDYFNIYINEKDRLTELSDLDISSLDSDGILNQFYDHEGKLYAIPFETSFYNPVVRLYNPSMLTEGQEPPTTLNELLELLISVKTNNPNQYILEDLYVKSPIAAYGDIAQAYGLTIGSSKYSPIHYSIENNTFYDEVVSDNMRSFLLYIKNLKQMGLIPEDYSKNNYRSYDFEKFYDNEIFSVYTNLNNRSISYPYTSFLISDDNPDISKITWQPTKMAYIVLSPKGINTEVNQFFTHLFTDDEFMNTMQFGIPETDYTSNNNIISLASHLTQTQPSVYGDNIPYVTGGFSHALLDNNAYYSKETISTIRDMYNIAINSNILSPIHIYDALPGLGKPTSSVINSFQHFFESELLLLINSDEITVDEFILKYISYAKKAGIDESINDLNSIIGSSFDYSY